MKEIYQLIFMFFVFGLFNIPGEGESGKALSVKTGFIDLGGTKLYYEEKGSGHPLVMIHGGGLDCHMWDDQFDVFASCYRVIRYDARNHGRSPGVPQTFSHHEDLHILMDRLNIKKSIVVGLSFGGYVAVDFALKYPERVSALILVSPGLTGYVFKSKAFLNYEEQYKKASEAENLEMIVEAFLRGWTDGPYRNPSQVNPAVRKKVQDMALRTLTNWNRESNEKRLQPPAIDRLSEIRVPTLAIVGSLDMPGIFEIVDLIKKNVPKSKKKIIKDAAHMVNMEKPELFNRIVLDFLSKIS